MRLKNTFVLALFSSAILQGCQFFPGYSVEIVNKTGVPVSDLTVEYGGAITKKTSLDPSDRFTVRHVAEEDGELIVSFVQNEELQRYEIDYITTGGSAKCNVDILESEIVKKCIS